MGYKDLLTYKQAEEIYDLTVRFCDLHINKRSRTHDQMVQAARSGKQNIAEGASQQTSLKFYIKEIGISRGSFEELLEDYLDFARQHGIKIWERGDERVEKVKRGEKGERMKFFFSFFSSKPSSSFPSNPSLPSSPLLQLFINYMVDLLKRTNYLLDQQRRGLEKKFAEEGGYTENLFKKRLEKRSSPKTFFPLILFPLLFPLLTFFAFFVFLTIFTFFPSNPAKAANINFSLEAWAKPATSVATKAILVKNNEMRLVTDGSGNPSCQIHNGTDWQTAAVSSAAISTGSWQHVVCTYDGTNIKVYVAGALTDTEAETANVNNTANGMIAGYDAGLTYNKFEGQIDSVRIFNRALSANEIKAHYDLGNLAQDGDMEDGDVAEFSQASEGSELLSNTGFETVTGDDFGSWTESVGDGAVASSTTVYAGTYALKATAGVSANSYAKQAAAVSAGKMYKVSFWTRGDGTYSGRYAIYDLTNLADIVATTTASVTGTTYTKITKYFTAPALCANVELYLYCPGTNTGVAYFDDVSVVAAQAASAESGTVADEDGLVGGWNFEDNANDVSGNGNAGTLNGDAAYSSSGRFGKALSLDGTGDYVSVASISDNSSIQTAEAWIYVIGAVSGNQYIIDQGGNNNWIQVFESHIRAGTVEYCDGTTTLNTNTWYHVANVFNGSNTSAYLNGSLDCSGTTSGATPAAIRIGDYSGGGYAFNGLIDSVRIYNRALSASEIAAHYSLGRGKHDNYAAKIKLAANDSNSYLDESLTNGQDYLASFWYHPGEDNANAIRFKISGSADPIMAEHNLMASSTMGLVGAWNFEEGSSGSADGDTIYDVSGNGNNGTATNGTWSSGKFGNAIDFDGDGDYVDAGNNSSLDVTTAFSVELWMNREAVSTQIVSLLRRDSGDTYGLYSFAGSTGVCVRFLDTLSAHHIGDVASVTTGSWNHIIGLYDGTYLKLYLNGSLNKSNNIGSYTVRSGQNNLIIGRNDIGEGRYFNGSIDSVRIYNRALTASEVYDRYKSTNWHKYELSFEADAGVASGAHLFKFIQDGTTSGNSIVYVDNFRVDKNLVNKGGFEAFAGGDPNIPTGWSATTDGLEAGEGIDEATEIHTGAKSFELIDADDGEGIKQAITVESGKWYTLFIWAKNNNQDVEAVISGAATDTIDLTTANNAWYKSNKTYLSSSTSLTVQIQAGAANQDGYFDDVSLVELDSYTGATTATTTTPTVAASSYGKGRWGEASGSIMIDGGDTLAYPTANNIYADEGTAAFWVKPGMDYNDFSENKYLWSVEGVARLYYNYSDYKFYFEIYDGSAWDSVQAASSAQSFTEDTWIHISASWNDRKNQVYLYVNGANDGSSTWGWYAQTLPTNMYFGAEYDGTNNADMYFDDVRVYDHSLSAEDIHRMYGSSPDPSASELRLHIPFTYGGGTGIGVNGTGLYDLTGTFTAGWGYRSSNVSGEYALGIFGSDNLQFSRGDQVDGYVYEYITPYQGTIKTWVKPAFDGSEATTNIIFQNGSSNYVKLYRHSSGALYWDIYDGTTTHRVSNDVSDWTAGTWYHVAAVWSNENTVSTSSTQYLMELYVNGGNGGNSYSNATFNTNFWAAFAPGTSYIGEDSSAANQFNGLIGGFAIDDKAWSEDEVSTDYNSGSGTLTSVSQDTLLYLPADSSDVDGMITWDKTPDVTVADGNMEDGDVAEWSESANGYTSAEGGTIAPEDGLLGGWNYEDDLTDASGNSKNGTLHTDPDCPTGYVFVPGNSAYSTSDFCVMQYEAKYDSNDDGTGDDAPSSCKYNTNYDTWDWGKDVATGCGYNVNEAARVVSTAAGSPIAGITHTQAALTACPAGDHIITNDEWMTIARDIEQVNANWTNGTVGSGCLFRGNSGETTCGYDGADPEKGTGRNARAKFTLSSGEEIYDISGNVWEHVKVDGSDTLIDNTPTDGGAVGWRWIEFTAITGYGDLSYDQIRPSDASWNATQGMGRLYTYNGVSSSHVFLRGGYWYDGTNAGAFTLNLLWGTTSQGYNVGFRCSR